MDVRMLQKNDKSYHNSYAQYKPLVSQVRIFPCSQAPPNYFAVVYRTYVFHIKWSRGIESQNWMHLIWNLPILANAFMDIRDVVNVLHWLSSNHEIRYDRACSFGIFVLFDDSELGTRPSNHDYVQMC
jgi:hypothetical protein